MMEPVKALNVAIVGGGPGCKAIMDMIFAERLSGLRMKLVGVADINPEAVGYSYAQEKQIYTTNNYRDLYKLKDLDMIIELTGLDEVTDEISRTKPGHVKLINHVVARIFWDIFQIEEERIAERKQSEEAMRSAYRKLRASLDAIQDIMVVVDFDFNLTDVNGVLIKVFGLPDKESVLGRKCFEILKGRKDRCPNCAVAEAYRTRAAAYRMTTIEDEASTGGRSFEIFSYPIMDEHGNLTGAVEFARDITERKRAEEALRKARENLERRVQERTIELGRASRELKQKIEERRKAEAKIRRLSSAVEQSIDGIAICDLKLKVTYVNDAFARMLGYSPEEIVGGKIVNLHSKEQTDEYKLFLPQIKTQGLWVGEIGHTRKDGTSFPAYVSFTLLKGDDGEPVEIVAIVRDITEQKRAEKVLRERDAELEAKSQSLEEAITSLRFLLKHVGKEKEEIEEKILSNVKKLIMPYVEKLKRTRLGTGEMGYVYLLEANLNDIISPFSHKLSTKFSNLTAKEIQVANLIKEGKVTKEIAELLNMSIRAVEVHRYNLRRKLGLIKSKANLKSYLLTLLQP